MAVSTRRGEREAEKLKKQEARERRRNFSDLYGICSAGGEGPPRIVTSSRELGALAPTPHVARQLGPEAASLRFWQGHPRQRTHLAPTSRHDTNRPHRIWYANHPAKTPGPCPGDRSRVPHAARAFDQHRSTRSFCAHQRGPHCTFPGSIAASLAVEMRRRSPSMENPLLPVRTEGTSSWINPCTSHEQHTCLLSSTFHTVRAVPPLRTWPTLAFTRLR